MHPKDELYGFLSFLKLDVYNAFCKGSLDLLIFLAMKKYESIDSHILACVLCSAFGSEIFWMNSCDTEFCLGVKFHGFACMRSVN